MRALAFMCVLASAALAQSPAERTATSVARSGSKPAVVAADPPQRSTSASEGASPHSTSMFVVGGVLILLALSSRRARRTFGASS